MANENNAVRYFRIEKKFPGKKNVDATKLAFCFVNLFFI